MTLAGTSAPQGLRLTAEANVEPASSVQGEGDRTGCSGQVEILGVGEGLGAGLSEGSPKG